MGDVAELLEGLASEVVRRSAHLHLWEWDYTLWVCLRLVGALSRAGDPHAHERLLNNHGVDVARMREALADDPAMLALLDGPLKPRYIPRTQRLQGQNESTPDLQLF